MSKIKILSEQVSNRIAAGEVIERPASVVKELIDNAIDAGASRIQVLIEDGGKRLIQVNDNGTGMDKEDSLLCLESHATSKITDVKDLDKLDTFGFRGEALPSIASVSKFKLTTKQKNSMEGIKVTADGGTIHSVDTVGRPVGTSIYVHDLFYNVPARKKFLKTQATEESHIHEIVLMATLARKDIAFELKFNQRRIFTTPETNDIRSRLTLFMGKDMTKHILPVNYNAENIHISGFIVSPNFTRTSRKDQRAFVNNRPISSDCIFLGIKDAYHTLVPKGRFAPAILYYKLAPNRFDINVHPSKKEIRFQEPSLIAQITTQAISLALRGISQEEIAEQKPVIPIDSLNLSSNSHTPSTSKKITKQNKQTPQDRTPDHNKQNKEKPNITQKVESNELKPNITQKVEPIPAKLSKITNASTPIIQTHNNLEKVSYLAELQQQYILAENSFGLIILNKKAAFERILFEKLMANFRNQQIESQNLLIPIKIDIPQNDVIYLKKSLVQMRNIGFEIEHFGGNTFIVTSIPALLPHENIQKLIFDIIDDLRATQGRVSNIKEMNLLKIISQKASNAKDIKGKEQCQNLIQNLIKCEMPYTCPRGKASISFISTNELLRRFGKR